MAWHEPFIRTRTHINSIQIRRRDISTTAQTRKHPFIICMGKRGRRIETSIRSLTMLLCIHLSGSNTQSYYRRPRNLGSSFWEYISKCCESRFRCLTFILFLLELCKSIIYFGGSIIQDNGHSVAREHLLLSINEDLCILQSTYVQGLANRRIISINLTYRFRNWNRNPEG